MVFKSIAAYLLEKYLGDYIQNLDVKKLKIDLWNGDVVLENLYLKPDALANFDLPLTIISGYLQKLSLHISWNQFYTHPTKITIDGFYLLVEPNTEVKYNAQREEKKEYDAKMKEVHKVEEFRKEREEYENSKKAPKHKDTFVERFKLHLIRNLEVSISNIHIAFEDKITKANHPFAFGITLNYIKLHTTNAEWEHVISEYDSPVIYKIGEINTMSIYWNSNIESRSDLSNENLIVSLHERIVKNDQTSFEKMTYILQPSNIQAKLKIAKMPSEQDYTQPVLDIKIDLKQINVNINRDQYSDLLDLLEFRDYVNLQSKYIKYYATIETDKPSLRRWKFAYAVIINEEVRPRLASNKWENIRANLNQCREYHTLYFKELNDKATKKEKQRVQELEKQIDVYNLIFVRRTAELEVRKKQAEQKQKSWWDTLSNWWSSNSNNDDPDFDPENVMTIDEKKKLYDAIGYEDELILSSYPKEYVDIDFSIQINLLEVNVWSNINENDSEFNMIARASISDTNLAFQRRPATSAFQIILDIDSLGLYGVVMNASEDQILNDNRPALIQPANRSQSQRQKLLHIEFETNPLNTNADYRIETILQSLAITYDAMTINKLIECFQPDVHLELKGVKKIAYSIHSNIKHRTQFLFNYNLRNIKALDINIDLQSSYFLLPENGAYRNDSSTICLDFGNFIVQGGHHQINKKEKETFEDAQEAFQNNDDTDYLSYIPLTVRLEDIRLLYAKPNEDWKNVNNERDSSMHLLLPTTLELNVFKCIYVNDAVLPLWKIGAQVSPVKYQFSDRSIFEIIKLIRSIPFPQLNKSSEQTQTIEELFMSESTIPQKNTKLIFEKIENMAPIKKNLQEVHNAEEDNSKKVSSEIQFIKLEATLDIPRIDLLIKKSSSDECDDTQPFVRVSFVSIATRTTIKTFDIIFDASLTDLVIVHEQFLINNNKPLYLFSTLQDEKLLSVKCLFTSPQNPLFYSDSYNSIENKIQVHISKTLAMFQMEAFESILRFQNDLIQKLPQQQQQDKAETKRQLTRKSNLSKDVKTKPISFMSTWQIEADLEQFRVIVGTESSQILDIQLKGLTINVSQSPKITSAYMILNDIHVLDLHANIRYRNIIVQQDYEKQMLRIEFSHYNHSKIHEKTLDEVDYDAKIHLTKMNIVLIYKYVDLILNVLNAFKAKNTRKHHVSSTESSTASNMAHKLQEKIFKIRFDIILHAPTILIPINSHSNEGIFIDLGQLTLKTHLLDESNRSLAEQHVLIFRNLLASRVNLNNNNEVVGHIILLECTELHTCIDRLLYPSKIKNEPEMFVKIKWEMINFTISKGDYLCLMKILKENFLEKVYHKISQPIVQEQLVDEQKNQDKISSNMPIQYQKLLSDGQISEKLRLDFEIKKITLTLSFDESIPTVRRATRNEYSKFIHIQMKMIEAHFQRWLNSSYNAKFQIQTFLIDDVREINLSNTGIHLLDRNFNVDQDAQIFIATIEFKPKNQTNATGIRQVNIQLESFYWCFSADCLMALKDFFNSSQSLDSEASSQWLINSLQSSLAVGDDLPLPAKSISTSDRSSRQSSNQPSSTSTSSEKTKLLQCITMSDIETTIDVVIKTPKILWFENQHDANLKCLVLRFAFQMRMISVHGETRLDGSIKDLTFYSSKYAEFNDSNIEYYIWQPMDINIVLVMNSEHQKFDLNIEDIAVNITPATIRTIVHIAKSMIKLQITSPDKKEKINSKFLFDPKPFKNAPFEFLEDTELDQEMIEQIDILELTTGTPSHKKTVVEERNKQKENEKKNQTQKFRSQQLTFNLKLFEIKFKLGLDVATKALIAICLSDLSVDVKNWSSDMNISSRIQVELALFNDHLLAWEPLIEPIVDERGEIISPWCIRCSTITQNEDGNENVCQVEKPNRKKRRGSRTLRSHRDSLSNTEEKSKDILFNWNAKNKIHIQAEHLLSVTLTKTSIELIQRLSAIFTDACKKDVPIIDDDDDKSILSVHNMTGYEILIDNITGIEFVKNNKSETSISLKHEESVPMTISDKRLSATHLPAISEQLAKNHQQFSVKVDKDVRTVDINQTCKRVYELGPSSIPDWPIQMLCDSDIYHDCRRIILSSIVKIHNRTIMPLVILDADSIEMRRYHTICRLEVNKEYYLPIQSLYMHSNPRLFTTIDENVSVEQIHNFISFDWANETTVDHILKTKNDEEIHIVIYKQSIEAYSENTDEPIRKCFHIYIKLALYLVNLLPIDVQCSIDGDDQINLKSGELYHSTSGYKKSVLIFTIPSYNNMKWISEPLDLNVKGDGLHNEYIVQFHSIDAQDRLRMILRVKKDRESYHASLYSPYWLLNSTGLKLEFKVDREKTVIDVVDSPFFICPKKFERKAYNEKGYIRLYSIQQDDTVSEWSEGFSLYVIKSTGMTSCKVFHDRTYTVCISIMTSSFGMSKIITLLPSMTIINNSTIELEIIEIVNEIEQGDWKLIKSGEMIPIWPRDIKNGVMCVRYVHNQASSSTFLMKEKHRTLLRMNDEDRPALHVEVTATDVYGIHTVFDDYKVGDAPVLLINCLRNQPMIYSQKEDEQTQLLPPQHYVYYTWVDPLKPDELSISYNGQSTTIELNPGCGLLNSENEKHVFYGVFYDGPQKVLICAEKKSTIHAVLDMPSLNELMNQYIQINFREIGISIIDDITRKDLFYITVNKSKKIWTETQKSLMKPLSQYLKANSKDKRLEHKKYHISKRRYVSFNEDIAEITNRKGHRTQIQRQTLDALWIGYAWSVSNVAIHVLINHIQIDNQLENTMFPVIFHPTISKVACTDMLGRPFIEFSAFKTTMARSKAVHYRYVKLLVQEFAFCLDRSVIISMFIFVKPKKRLAAPTITINRDLKSIEKPLRNIIKSQVQNQSEETKIYFELIHLSPLKVHFSLSVYGTKPSEKLLAEYPMAEFLLHILKIAKVQDVMLKLNYYERKKERFTITKLKTEINGHYQHQLFKQVQVAVLDLDVLGNPFHVISGVAEGVESFFYEPYKGAMGGPIEFIEGIASGSRHLTGSIVGGIFCAGCKITGVIGKSSATLTFDKDYQSTRIQRKVLAAQTTLGVVRSGKIVAKDVVNSVKDVVKKPISGAREDGSTGFIKGLGKGFLGLIARPLSSVADLVSTSCSMIKRRAIHEKIVHRVRYPRFVGRDGIIRPSTAYATMGVFICQRLNIQKFIKSDDYIAHIICSESESGWLLATSKRLMFVTENLSDPNVYEVQWHFKYKELNGSPAVKFDPDQIEVFLKKSKVFGKIKKGRVHEKTIAYQNVGEARYIVDTITKTMHAMEL